MKKYNENSGYTYTNRNKARRPRKGMYWCCTCDACLVGPGERCRNCKHKDTSKVAKRKRKL